MYKWLSICLLGMFLAVTTLSTAEARPVGSPIVQQNQDRKLQAKKNVKNNQSGQMIRVGLWSGQKSIAISSKEKFIIRDGATQKGIRVGKFNERIFLTVKDGKFVLKDKAIDAPSLLITAEGGENPAVEINKRSYRGTIKVTKTAKGIDIINVLPLEEYLYSIVPSEMTASWHMEALKAQAVAARTYALANLHTHEKAGYDVCTGTHCQVYKGISSEGVKSTKAVDATRGVVMLYNGKPITAAFHSNSGGRTENAESVWGTYSPYLRSVSGNDEKASQYKWEKKMLPVDIAAKLRARGYNIGVLKSIQLSELKRDEKTLSAQQKSDRTESGRVKQIKFNGTLRSVVLDGSKVRSVLSLNSSLFDISLIVPYDKSIEVQVGMNGKKEININVPPYKEKSRVLTDKSTENLHTITGRNGEQVVFKGYGWGHGLGMSQWGAKSMADKVAETNTTFYQSILQHYYTNIELKKIY